MSNLWICGSAAVGSRGISVMKFSMFLVGKENMGYNGLELKYAACTAESVF